MLSLSLLTAFGTSAMFNGLGVFFDTYDNSHGPHSSSHKHPYISVMVNDGREPYHHDAEGTHSRLHPDSGCHLSMSCSSSCALLCTEELDPLFLLPQTSGNSPLKINTLLLGSVTLPTL